LQDIAKDGRVMITRDDWRSSMVGLAPGATKETNLGWHDWTIPRDISDDGSLVSFDESGEAGGETGALYVRRTDGSPAVRLGDGLSPTLSPDGKWALAVTLGADGRHSLVLLPTGAGEPRHVSTGDVDIGQAYFFPDGRHIAEEGSTADSRGVRIFVQDLDAGAPRPISPEGITFRYRGGISPDGRKLAALDPEGKPIIYDVAGGPASPIPGVQDGDEPIQWTPDGKNILLGRNEVPNRVFVVSLETGQRKLFKAFPPLDPGGLLDNAPPGFSRDLKSYVYGYSRLNSDVYLVDGLK
jgi:hypothetical protein